MVQWAKSRFSSLYIGILAATGYAENIVLDQMCFSSLYIGILAATCACNMAFICHKSFSSLYIGILAATDIRAVQILWRRAFQFPLHRDPRCNKRDGTQGKAASGFQFPLHRDPRCNSRSNLMQDKSLAVSVPFTSGSSLQPLCFSMLVSS